MITLYTWGTPNGRKISVMLEECGLPYTVKTINIGQGEQFTPEFLALNPNNKIPAIVDEAGPDGAPVTVFESGAILIYLAEKTGSFLPQDARDRLETLQWLMFQMASVGPMFGQTHHFLRFAPEQVPYAIKRYNDETRRLYGVLEGRLENRRWIVGEPYTIADIALYPWVDCFRYQDIDLAHFPNVQRWHDEMSGRPAVQRGMRVPA